MKDKSSLTGAQSTGQMAQSSERSEKELVKAAILSFRENLEKLRRIVPVETICMHGSPLSRWDNRLLWKYYDYRDFGIGGEPYFDIDFEKVLYLTDTGRRWDGEAVSIRDKAESRGRRAESEEPGVKSSGLRAQSSGREAQYKAGLRNPNLQPATCNLQLHINSTQRSI